MKLVKSLLLGSAAGLVALSGAQAADLPVKAKAVEYVKVCSLYGAGFYYIPGTDTCIKLGGYLRVDGTFNGSGAHGAPSWSGDAGQGNRNRNYMIARPRFDLTVDTRTATEYGVVRTYFEGVYQWTSNNGSTSDNLGGGTFGAWFAFIQFAGFTIGKAVSQFDAPWSGYPSNINGFLLGGADDVTGVTQLTYTADFGQGVTAALSIQDPSAYYQGGLWDTTGASAANVLKGTPGIGTAANANSYGGVVSPDIVGMVRVDQAWGMFQASAALHNIHANYYNPSDETSGHPDDAWGWAGQLALTIKNIPTGAGDVINMSAGYANGASRYIIGGNAGVANQAQTNFAMYGGSSILYQSLGIGIVGDGVFGGTNAANGTGIEKSTAWGFRGGYTHNWDPYWNTSLFGSYSAVRWSDAGAALICSTGVLRTTTLAGGTCNPDFNIWQIGSITRWTPVKNLTFSGEVMYTGLDQNMHGLVGPTTVGATKPNTAYEWKDQGTWTLQLRAQRNF